MAPVKRPLICKPIRNDQYTALANQRSHKVVQFVSQLDCDSISANTKIKKNGELHWVIFFSFITFTTKLCSFANCKMFLNAVVMNFTISIVRVFVHNEIGLLHS